MKIVFLGTIGIYHPVLAAHLYLNGDWGQDIANLKGWGDFRQEASGDPILVGCDQDGNQVYGLGAGIEVEMTRRTIEQLTGILGHDQEELVIQTISVGAERVLIYLYRMGQLQVLQNPINTIAKRLLQNERDIIGQQVNAFQAKIKD